MNFQEHHRRTCRDGSVHVLSVAYAAVESFIQADDALKAIELEVFELRKRYDAVVDARRAAAEAMGDALDEHYEGDAPRAVLFGHRTVIIGEYSEEMSSEVIEPGGWSDLFRIERPDAAAQPAPAAAEA